MTLSQLAGAESSDSFVYGTNTTTVTNAHGHRSVYTYTTFGGKPLLVRVDRDAVSTCAATAAQTAYDANGYIDFTIDWRGIKTDYTYDSAGRLERQINAVGTPSQQTLTNQWNGINLLETTFKNALGVDVLKRTYAYVPTGSAAGQLASETVTDLRTGLQRQISYAYSFHSNNNLASVAVSRALPSGVATTTQTYDTLGNLKSVSNAAGHTVHWAGHNGLGLPSRMTNANGTATDYIYDAQGRMTMATLLLPAGSRSTRVDYHPSGLVSDIYHPTGAVQRFRYNAALRVVQVGDALNRFVSLPLDLATNTGAARSAREIPGLSGSTPVAYAGGEFVQQTQRDGMARSWRVLGNAGQETVYAYDGNGNLTSQRDVAGRTSRYEYDAMNRLTKFTAPDGGEIGNDYDADGNLASVTDPRGLVTRYEYTGFGEVKKLVSPDTGETNYSYDNAGRLQTETRAGGYVTIS